VHYKCKKNSKRRINEHRKNRCEKIVNAEGNFLTLKLYPPLKNTMEGMHIVKGGNISKYWAKVNTL
jgi:hypothetical protein